MTPFDVSKSTITIGSPSASGARNEYCRSDERLNLNAIATTTKSELIDYVRIEANAYLPSSENETMP